MEEAIIVVMLSLTFGSFANNVISYLLGSSKLDLLRSSCHYCGKNLSYKELIPVISYVFQTGKCNYCKRKIPIRFLVIEISSICIGLLSYIKYGWGIELLVGFSLYFVLMIIGTVDFYTLKIPNQLIFAMLLIVILKSVQQWEFNLANSISAIIIAFTFTLINFIANKSKGKDVIGFGDIKLLFVLFLIFPIPLALLGLWISSLLAIISSLVKRKQMSDPRLTQLIPYGFFISAGYIIIDLIGDKIFKIYYL